MPSNFKNASTLAGSTATTVYTCPANTQAVVHALYIANVDGTSQYTAIISVFDSVANASHNLGYNIPVPAGSTFVLDKPVNLKAGDYIQVTASTANKLDCFASVLEIN